MARRSGRGSPIRGVLVYILFISFLSGAWFVIKFHQKYVKFVTQDVSTRSDSWLPEYEHGSTIFETINKEEMNRYEEEIANHFLDRDGGIDSDETLVEEVGNEEESIDSRSKNDIDRSSNEAQHISLQATNTQSNISQHIEINMAKGNNKLYCMVPFLWSPRFLQSYTNIHKTWGKRCHILRFFIDPIIGDSEVGYFNMTLAPDVIAARNVNLTLPNDVVVLHDMRRPWHTCRDEDEEEFTCRNIWEKIWRAWVYVATGKGGSTPSSSDFDVGVNACEWFVKVDADTYLFPENLIRYVKSRNWSYNDHHYFGHVLHHRKTDRNVSIVAGAAVFFSRATLLAAVDSFQKMPLEDGNEEEDGTCRDAFTGTEEVVTAVCLKEHSNIIAEAAIDSQGREGVSLFEVDDIVGYNRTDQGEWWFWEGKKRYPCHDTGGCLADLPLAFHNYKDSRFFLDLEKEFYGIIMKRQKDNSVSKRIAARRWENFGQTYRYFERVRNAMRAVEELEQSSLTSRGEEKASTRKKFRLYCMVPFIWAPKYIHSYDAIRNTWGKRCDHLKFFIDPIVEIADGKYVDLRSQHGSKVVLPEDVVVVYHIHRPWHICDSPQEKNCRNIWEKVWRSWLWIDDNGESELSEWFVKVDADTYLFPEHFTKYVDGHKWSPNDHHYFGHKLRHSEDRGLPPIIAGAAVFFSRATVKGAASIFRHFKHEEHNTSKRRCSDSFTSSEETVTAICLKQHLGMDATHVANDLGEELITISPIEDAIMWNRTEQGEWWYWKNKQRIDPNTGREIHQCCGEFPIAFHGYKDPLWFYKLEHEFYNVKDFPEVSRKWKQYRWHNLNETKIYFDRVRGARNTYFHKPKTEVY